MGEICEKRRMMEKDKYWTEFESNRHQFFKIMIGDFEHQLRVPRKFMRNFKEKLSDTINLRGPSGHMWPVNLARTVDDVLFQNGWENFVQDHSLEETDFLVFHYNGNSSFNVLIFDATGCEREGSYFVKKQNLCSSQGCVMQEKEDSIEVVDLDEVLEEESQKSERGHQSSKPVGNYAWPKGMKGRGIQRNNSVGARQVGRLEVEESENSMYMADGSKDFERTRPKKLKLVDEDESETSSEVQILSSKHGRKKKRRIQNAIQVDESKEFSSSEESGDVYGNWPRKHKKGRQRRDKNATEITDQPCRFHPFKSSGQREGQAQDTIKWPLDRSQSYGLYFISSRRQITEKEKQRAYKLATEHSSTGPSILAIMKPTHVYKYFAVNIHKEWGSKHIAGTNLEIQLRVPPNEKKWDVQFKNSQWKCGLTRGWSNFVMDNNLEEHDVCVFELTDRVKLNKQPVILDVFIYRVVEELVPLTRFVPPTRGFR